MIAELVGLPGSGKSTFARALEQKGKWVRVRINGRGELLYYSTLFIVRHPISALMQLGWLFRYRGHSSLWYTKFVNLFLIHNAKYMKASSIPHAIIDQGHLQNVLSLFDVAISRETINQYLAILPLPDVCVYFDIPKTVRVTRMSERGYGVREHIALDLRNAWQEASEEHFAVLCNERQTRPCTSLVVVLDNDGETLNALMNFRLWRFVMHLRMPTEKAHGLQIAKTLEALTTMGEHVELWVPRRTNSITDDVFAYYALAERFPIRTLRSFEALRFVSVVGSLAYWMDALCLLVVILFTRTDTETIYYTRSAPIAWLLKQKGARTFYEAHLWPNSKVAGFRYLLRKVDGVIANSEGTANEFRKHGFQHVVVIRNGVDIEKFAIETAALDARKEIGIQSKENIVMYVGSFARWKGVATLYAAWKKMQKEFPDAVLVLVGGEASALAGFSECSNIKEDKSVLILSHQSASRIPLLLRSANILVLPNEPVTTESIRYTSPIKLFEYLASGRPAVISDLPSMREVVNENCATFFTAGDSEDLAKTLSLVLSHPKEREVKAKAATLVADEYSWIKRAERIVNFITSR